MLEDKISEAEATLKLAAEMSLHYYNAPLIVCYSGGKDSDVMLDIAKRCLKTNEFEVLNSHTTVDAPETVYHIRDVFKECEALGIKTTIKFPTYKGERTTMWKLIEDKCIPPTRLMRYCCQVLKEASTPNRMCAVGVRESESVKRRGRDAFAVRGRRKSNNEWRSLRHTFAMYQIDKNGRGGYECEMISACKNQKDTLCNPIYKFTDCDIWDYVKKFNVKMNPLYAQGFSRVGCVGCPLSVNQAKEFERYPKYKENYIKAFDRMLKRREERGMGFTKYHFKNGEEVFRWWIGENPNQVRIEDILSEREETQ